MAMLRPPDPMKYVAFGDHPATNAIHTANFPRISSLQVTSVAPLFYQPVRAFAAGGSPTGRAAQKLHAPAPVRTLQ